MPRTLYDDDNNPIEIPTDEELKELQEKAGKFDSVSTEKSKLEKTLEEKEAEFKKYKSVNQKQFTDLKHKSKEEVEEYRSKLDDTQKVMFDEIIGMREERDKERQSKRENWDKKILKQLAGDDKDLETKLKDIEKSYVGYASTFDEQLGRYQRAYKEAVGSVPEIDPLNAFFPSTSKPAVTSTAKSFTDTPKGKALAEELFGKPKK